MADYLRTGTVAVWAAFRAVRRLESYATLIALVVVSVACAVIDPDVELVGASAITIATAPSTLPSFFLLRGGLPAGDEHHHALRDP